MAIVYKVVYKHPKTKHLLSAWLESQGFEGGIRYRFRKETTPEIEGSLLMAWETEAAARDWVEHLENQYRGHCITHSLPYHARDDRFRVYRAEAVVSRSRRSYIFHSGYLSAANIRRFWMSHGRVSPIDRQERQPHTVLCESITLLEWMK